MSWSVDFSEMVETANRQAVQPVKQAQLQQAAQARAAAQAEADRMSAQNESRKNTLVLAGILAAAAVAFAFYRSRS